VVEESIFDLFLLLLFVVVVVIFGNVVDILQDILRMKLIWFGCSIIEIKKFDVIYVILILLLQCQM